MLIQRLEQWVELNSTHVLVIEFVARRFQHGDNQKNEQAASIKITRGFWIGGPEWQFLAGCWWAAYHKVCGQPSHQEPRTFPQNPAFYTSEQGGAAYGGGGNLFRVNSWSLPAYRSWYPALPWKSETRHSDPALRCQFRLSLADSPVTAVFVGVSRDWSSGGYADREVRHQIRPGWCWDPVWWCEPAGNAYRTAAGGEYCSYVQPVPVKGKQPARTGGSG